MGRLGAGHRFGYQPRHARPRIEPRPPRATAIHHHADILNGQRGFGDRRRQHHLAALIRGRNRGPLRGKIHRAEKRAYLAIRRKAPLQQCLDPANFTLAGQEHQNAAGGRISSLNHQIGKSLFIAFALGQGPVKPTGLDRIAAPLRGDHRHIAHQVCDGFGVERRGHRQ